MGQRFIKSFMQGSYRDTKIKHHQVGKNSVLCPTTELEIKPDPDLARIKKSLEANDLFKTEPICLKV